MALCPAERREAALLAAVIHVVRYGKLGKQSKARLRAALRENAKARTHNFPANSHSSADA